MSHRIISQLELSLKLLKNMDGLPNDPDYLINNNNNNIINNFSINNNDPSQNLSKSQIE